MMDKRSTGAAAMSALLAIGTTAAMTTAQEPDPVDESSAVAGTTGVLEIVTNEDGQSVWYLNVEGELIKLSFGPAWFNDLTALFGADEGDGVAVGDEVTVDGNVRSMSPNENASEVALEKAGQTLKVKSVDGEGRDKGKPAWAGGPKDQGESHPGFQGWSKGQANKEAAQAAKAERDTLKAAKKAATAEAKAARKANKGNRSDD